MIKMKTLIAYFSVSGTTKNVAQRIQKLVDADLFSIEGNKNYGNYFKAIAIGGKEIVTKEEPILTSHIDHFEDYDCILLGYPIWYGNCPRIIRTFLNEYDFSGKDIYIFCTSGSSGPYKSLQTIKDMCPNAHVHSAIRIDKQNDNEIKMWLNQ